jgi:peptidoglycan/LPS O-acetylase OafA/YrhL
MGSRKSKQAHRIPSLDGLRAISILLVVFGHLIGTRGFILPEAPCRFFNLSDMGVRVFFVISGFLITNLLLQELDARNNIHLTKFYFRRTFRIFLPYYSFLFVVALLQATGSISLAPGDLLHALTYTTNYHPQHAVYVAHSWSLSVEEQFYLLWPMVLLLAGRRRAILIACSLLIACPLLRLSMIYLFPGIEGMGLRFETVADGLAAGCVLAGGREWLKSQPAYNRLLGSRLFVAVPAMVFAASSFMGHTRIYNFVCLTVINIGIALCVEWCVTNDSGRVGRVLNSRPLVFIGLMSYSIYLWQQVFVDPQGVYAVSRFPLNIVFICAASLASYYLIERPSLSLRQRVEARMFAPSVSAAAEPRPSEAV